MRRQIIRAIPAASLILFASAFLACARKEEPAPAPAAQPTVAYVAPTAVPASHVTDVQLGKAVGADKRVTTPMDAFKPRDTIFASVATDGAAPSTTLHVKWTYQNGQTVKEDSRTISTAGPAVTEFSVQKPGGWPKGEYTVEVSIEGQPASTKTFSVS